MLRKVVKDKVFIFGEVPTGDIDGINTIFLTDNMFEITSIKVYLNGLSLREGLTNDFIINNSTTIQILDAPEIGDVLEVDYIEK